MAETLAVIVSGDRAIAEKFGTFPQEAHKRLHATIEIAIERLAGLVRAHVPKLTGRLESEIRTLVGDKPERIVGLVYVQGEERNDYAKAGALEYGAHGTAKVSAHSMRLDHVFANALNSPLTVSVDAYSRPLNIAAQRFLRDPAAEMKSEIESNLRAAVDQTVAATNETNEE